MIIIYKILKCSIDPLVDASEELLVPYIQQKLRPRNLEISFVSLSSGTIIIVWLIPINGIYTYIM